LFTDKLHERITALNEAHLFSGVVQLQQADTVLFQQAYGFAHRGWAIANRLDTRFRIASVSKMFTAVAILQLIEAGQLAFTTRVVEALGLADTQIPPEVTVEHLLTMTAGIADWFEESGDAEANWAAFLREQPIYLLRKHQDYLPLFAYKEPLAGVGETYQYSNASYLLLGLLIEQVTGLAYEDYVRQQIFQKIGMTRSDFLALDGVDAEVAEGYLPVKAENDVLVGWKKNIYAATPEGAADGGATATAADLIRFSQALRKHLLLAPALTSAMLTPKVLVMAEQIRGYTWKYSYAQQFLLDEQEQIVRYGHTGEEEGISCRLYHYPQQTLDVVILGNQTNCAGRLGWEIHDLIVGEKASYE